MKSFSVHSRQQDEREIVREQRSFYAGMFTGIPSSIIPDNGVAYLKNFKNYGNRLEGRSGSRIWGDYVNGPTPSNIPVDDNINGSYYFKYSERVVLHLGTNIYISMDTTLTQWNKAIYETIDRPSDTDSVFDELNNSIIMYNAQGIYKIYYNTTMGDWMVSKLNSNVPNNKIDVIDANNEDTYEYRYIYSMSKFNDDFFTNYTHSSKRFGGNRQSPNAVITQESGTNAEDENYIDYTTIYSSGAIGSTSGTHNLVAYMESPEVTTFTSFNNEQQWDCYSIWRTKDIGVSGYDPQTGVANSSDQYIWVDDIPVMQPFRITAGTADGLGNREYIITPSDSYLSNRDIGSRIHFFDASGNGRLGTILSITPSGITVDKDYDASDEVAFIGAGWGAKITISGGIITVSEGNAIFDYHEGAALLTEDGYRTYIDGMSGVSGTCSDKNLTITTPTAACWGIGARNFYDNVSDDDLGPRVAGYPCYQRLFKPLPNCNVGCVSNGFLFGAVEGENNIYYSQVPYGFEYLAGYYHPFYQVTYVKDKIVSLNNIPDNVVIYGKKSTNVIPLNVTDSVDIPNLGINIAILSNQVEINNSIGVLSAKSIKSLENNAHILVTNEPAIRIFDGAKYSNNLAYPYFNYILNSIGFNIVADYNSINGYTIWGSSDSVAGSPNVCYSYGMGTEEDKQGQGVGFSEITGSYPAPNKNGVLNIVDSHGYSRSLILDYNDKIFYDITTRKGPNVYRELFPCLSDKCAMDGNAYGPYSGQDITPEVTFKNDTGESENFILEHYFSKFYIGAKDTDYSIYSTSYPDTACNISISSFDDYTASASTSKISEDTNVNRIGEIVFNKKIEGTNLSTTLTFYGPNISLYKREQHYIAKDIRYNASNYNAGEYDAEYALNNPIFWINANGPTPLQDRISDRTVNELSLGGPSWYKYEGPSITPTILRSEHTLKVDLDMAGSSKITISGLTSGSKTLFMSVYYPSGWGSYSPEVDIGSSTFTITQGSSEDGRGRVYQISGISGNDDLVLNCNFSTTGAGLGYIADLRIFDGDVTDYYTYFYNEIINNNWNGILPLL